MRDDENFVIGANAKNINKTKKELWDKGYEIVNIVSPKEDKYIIIYTK